MRESWYERGKLECAESRKMFVTKNGASFSVYIIFKSSRTYRFMITYLISNNLISRVISMKKKKKSTKQCQFRPFFLRSDTVQKNFSENSQL